MVRHLPPLNQLRAFEAAARHGSFKGASGELNVTQAAISHQIKGLEEQLGRSLFHRTTRGVAPTEDARRYQEALTRALDMMADATDAIRAGLAGGPMTVSVPPSFGTRWLLPRLDGFRRRHPEIQLRLEITEEVVDFACGRIDAAIRHGRGGWHDLDQRVLFEEELVATAAPELVPAERSLGELLAGRRLLAAGPRRDEWPAWFAAMDLGLPSAPEVVEFPTLGLALDAAVSGQGLALADRRLVAGDLAAGRLVRLPGKAIRLGRKLYLVHPRRDVGDRKVAALQEWLEAELADHGHRRS